MDTLTSIWQSADDVLSAVGQTTDLPQLLALASALGWASGLRLYFVLFFTGLAGIFGWVALPEGLDVLQHPAVLVASGFMLFVEFFIDKFPVVDSLWGAVHSVIRLPAGTALAAAVFGADSATMGAVAGLLGGTLSATSFATQASVRAAVNTSPEPFTNISVSLVEDATVIGAMWLAISNPVAFGIALIIVLVLSIWLLVVLAKFLKSILRRIGGWFGGGGKAKSLAQ